MNTNFLVIGLTQLGIKPKSTDTEADAVTTRPSEDQSRVHGTATQPPRAIDSQWVMHVYSVRLESTAICLMSFLRIELLLVATLINVASGWNVMLAAVKDNETDSLRLTGLSLLL